MCAKRFEANTHVCKVDATLIPEVAISGFHVSRSVEVGGRRRRGLMSPPRSMQLQEQPGAAPIQRKTDQS